MNSSPYEKRADPKMFAIFIIYIAYLIILQDYGFMRCVRVPTSTTWVCLHALG